MTFTPVADLLVADPFTPTVDVAGIADDRLLAEIRAVEQFRRRLDAHQTLLLGEVDARGTTDIVDGHRTREWLVAKENLAGSVAWARVLVARRLRTGLPETAAALADGRISFEHARELAAVWNPRIATQLTEMEPHLIADAQGLSFKEWKSRLALIVALWDQDGSFDPDAELSRNLLSMAVVGDELVLNATLIGDARVVIGQTIGRFADQLFRQYTTDQQLTGVEPPSRRTLQALALLEICRRANAVDLDTTRPAGTEAVVVIDGSQLGEPSPHASDGNGEPLQAPGRPLPSVLTLCCSASLAAMIMDGMGRPMDHGREIRNANRAQRRLLRARDGGCTFPGCGLPHAWTDAHHITEWNDQGGTDIANLASLCRHHHGVVHRNGWSIALSDDGWAIFTRPDGTRFWGQRHGQQRAGPAPPAAA